MNKTFKEVNVYESFKKLKEFVSKNTDYLFVEDGKDVSSNSITFKHKRNDLSYLYVEYKISDGRIEVINSYVIGRGLKLSYY